MKNKARIFFFSMLLLPNFASAAIVYTDWHTITEFRYGLRLKQLRHPLLMGTCWCDCQQG